MGDVMILVALRFLMLAALAAQAQPSAQVLEVQNKTDSLQVVQCWMLDNQQKVRMVILNNSSKSICETIISFGNFTRSDSFWALGDPLRPGQSVTIDHHTRGGPPPRIVIKAIMFDDGSGEGDAVALSNSIQYQRGYLQEVGRVYDLVNSFIKDLGSDPKPELLKHITILRHDLEVAESAPLGGIPDSEFWLYSGRSDARQRLAAGLHSVEARILQLIDTGSPELGKRASHYLYGYTEGLLRMRSRLSIQTGGSFPIK